MTSNQRLAATLRVLASGYSTELGRDAILSAAQIIERTPDETSSVITPLEQLLVEWWSTDMENAELFNRAVRLSPALAAAMNALPEKSE